MIKQDIPLYKLDLTGTSEFNHVKKQYGSRKDVAQSQIVIPPFGPFYQKSFKMTDVSGKPLVLGEDYEFYGIMNKLTAYTAKPVGLFVRILKDEITEWIWDYQVVGNFNKLTNEILNMLHSIYEDDRYVLWENIENKPLWFDPEIHLHDLTYEIFGFTDLARELTRVAHIQGTQKAASVLFLENFRDHIEFYCNSFRALLKGIIDNHANHKYDQHGVRKEHIGLGLVDNNFTATLEETLEGLRDDLFITPYNAALAVTAAAGRNDKLYPSGKLPLLRYGSDTFIPPTIAGSFEGLGGQSRNHCAVVESDGTLLILQHRNNGKYRGLYYVRCSNYRSQAAEYEFTAYQYTHPTATAQGANLDVVINGSNRYIMVVGDSVKNMWYWCETHNTLNPDRHILHRMTGEWVNEMASLPKSTWNSGWNKALVMADDTYRDYFMILQSYQIDDFVNNRRPAWGPFSKYQRGGINVNNAGYSINVIRNLSDALQRATVDFTHPVFGNSNDKFFTPWWPELEDNPVNGYNIKSLFARYNPPMREMWMFRTVHGMWRKNPGGADYGFRIQITGNESSGTFENPNITGMYPVWRGKMTFSVDGSGIKVKIEPGPSNATLFEVNPYDRTTAAWKEYVANCHDTGNIDGADSVGSADIGDGLLAYSDGYANGIFPSGYQIVQTEYGKGYDKILGIEPSKWYYKGILYFDEKNPLGLGASFIDQAWMTADTDNPNMSGLLSRQGNTKEVKWIYRRSGFANADWTHKAPTNVSSYNARAYRHYPHVSDVKEVDLGCNVIFNQTPPIPTGVNKISHYKRLFACSSESRLDGKLAQSVTDQTKANGDLKFVFETTVKVVDNVVKFTHERVVNIKRMLEVDLLAVFGPRGYTADDIKNTFVIATIFDNNDGLREMIMVQRHDGNKIYVAAQVGRVYPQGNTSTVNGGTHWDDARWEQISNVDDRLLDQNARNIPNVFRHINYNLPGAGKIATGMVASMPWKSRNDAGGITDNSTVTVMIRSDVSFLATYGDGRCNMVYEINTATNQIVNATSVDGGFWGSIIPTWIPIPFEGIVFSDFGIMDFEGSGLGGRPPRYDNVWQSITARIMRADRNQLGMTNIITPAYTVYFNAIKNVLLAGKMYDIDSTYIDILDQEPNPANKTFYVYVYYASGVAEYLISPTVRPESSTQSLIATVICGPTQIDRIIPYNRFSMNGVIISAKRQGSAILASSGTIDGVGDTSTILLDSDFIP